MPVALADLWGLQLHLQLLCGLHHPLAKTPFVPVPWRGKAGPSTQFGTCILCGGLALRGFSEVT